MNTFFDGVLSVGRFEATVGKEKLLPRQRVT
jgi:hypothetical protein